MPLMAVRGQTYDRDDELWLRLDDGRHDLRSQGQMGARDAFRIGCGAPESPHGGATAGWRHGSHEEVHSRESIVQVAGRVPVDLAVIAEVGCERAEDDVDCRSGAMCDGPCL